MKSPTPKKLLIKIVFILLPFALLFIYYFATSASPFEAQKQFLDEKINSLVIHRSPKPAVLVAGESRAEKMFIPDIFTKMTGQSVVNVGIGGGTLPMIVQSLQNHNLLNTGQIIIVSVSSFEINDNYISYDPLDRSAIAAEKWSLVKLRHSFEYFKNTALYYIEGYRSFLRFWSKKNNTLSNEVLAANGYVKSSGLIDVKKASQPDYDNVWYKDPKLDGKKRIAFEESLKELCRARATTVIYLGPTAPAWRQQMGSIGADKVEQTFANIISDKIKDCKNVHFFDFTNTSTALLDNSTFADYVHLNEKGGEIFSELLAKTMLEKGYIKKAMTASQGR